MRLCLPALALSFVLVPAPTLVAQQTILPLWPHAAPEPAQTADPEVDLTTPDMPLISGHRTARLANVTHPTLSVFPPPAGRNTGAAVLVFPGGGYVRLAWDGEGLDACRWLNSIGVTCLLVKYRVPYKSHYPDEFADLEDAQQAMRLARSHAAAWHIDPNRIGAMGFSAGAHLTVVLSTHADDHHVESTPAAPDVDPSIDARADFALVIYPGYLTAGPALDHLDPVLTPDALTPPTFLLQAENDPVHVQNSLVYYIALKNAKVPAEMHLFATGGHGFGLHPPNAPEEHWTQLATTWLRSIKVLPPLPTPLSSPDQGWGGSARAPCAMPPSSQPPPPGRPDPTTTAQQTDPACW